MLRDSVIKAVIWDCGGVLVRTEDASGRRKWEQELGLSAYEIDRIVLGSQAWILAQRGAITEEGYWDKVRTQLGLDRRAIEVLRHDFYKGDQVNSAALDAVTRLRPHYKQAILSNAVPSLLETLRDRFQIAHLFEVIIISASIRVMKPDSRAYRAVLDALRLGAEETIFIDDLSANVRGAKQVGMHAIHFQGADDPVPAVVTALLARLDP